MRDIEGCRGLGEVYKREGRKGSGRGRTCFRHKKSGTGRKLAVAGNVPPAAGIFFLFRARTEPVPAAASPPPPAGVRPPPPLVGGRSWREKCAGRWAAGRKFLRFFRLFLWREHSKSAPGGAILGGLADLALTPPLVRGPSANRGGGFSCGIPLITIDWMRM